MSDQVAQRPPLRARATPLAWARERLFHGPVNTAITLLLGYALVRHVPALLNWLLLDAQWTGTSRDDCTGGGACWIFVRLRLSQFIYGFYPEAERWRVNLAGLLAGVLILLLVAPDFRFRWRLAGLALAITAVGGIVLLSGGVFGLASVETRSWGGLMVTVFMAVYGAFIAAPIAIVMALGRQSRLPVIRWMATIYIEFWRGVPVITVIFLASNLLPLIVPAGVTVDRLARALIALALVISAYMAEVLRGGLQAVPVGQTEAARALGMGYGTITGLIVLPQALRMVIPGLVNEFIALFKNTTLVLIVSLFDFLGIVQASLTDPKWVGLNFEAYLFAGAVFWIVCFAMSRWSQRLERRLARRSY